MDNQPTEQERRASQRDRIMGLLRRGPVNSYDLTYRHHIKQAPTRIFELRKRGVQILSKKRADHSVDYHLLAPAS